MALELKNYIHGGINTLKQLQHVHGRLIRLNLNQDNYLLNWILKLSFDFAPKTTNYYPILLFSQSEQPNIYVWNTLIRGLVSNNSFDQAIHFYHLMRCENLLPNSFTFPFVLKACARVSDSNLGLRIHGLVVKAGFDCDVFVMTSLVSLYAKCGYLEAAYNLFDEIPDKNVVSWTAIISGYIDFGKYEEAIDVFKKMVEMKFRPDSFTIVRVLSACTMSRDSKRREWIHKYAVDIGMESNVFVGTSLVDMYVKCGDMEKARKIFDGLSVKDIVSWSTMIQGYASNSLPKQALDLFFAMRDQNVEPDCYSMVGVLAACASFGALELGEWASNLMDKAEFLSNPILGTALIDMYAKCGGMLSAFKVFNNMKEKDLIVWNAMICGLAMNGHSKAAFTLFGQVEKFGIRPDGNTFIGLLCACTHAGLVNEGKRYFNHMREIYCLSPRIEHYGCMVDLLARSGLLDEAHNMITNIPMEANAVIWGALLGGCRMYKNTQLAEHVLNRLIEIEPLNSGNYILLSNIYSTGHRWDDAEKIRLKMIGKGIQKSPAYSWIEVNGVIHEFLVRDKSHPLSDKIYAKLDELGYKLKAMGYIPSTELVLFDIEDEEKQQFIGYHSEKLAIAFGLLSTPNNVTIRVVKNLRVCGDCHTFIKLVSMITGRDIIIRDNNRFHCFNGGSCSCKDYW